ncbi:hypothetical protein ABMA28_010328 [Loxostege sticticalis]|uniref:DUF4780 domain-containing protein n=2 Tax=Loxostege sticticalis TaxID=481309 RepID=A0ABD0SAG5_LOXSC
MSAQGNRKLPQEGTTHSGESLTESNSVCPAYSGGDNLCPEPGPTLDLSGLAEAIPTIGATNTTTVSEWTVVAHRRRPNPNQRGQRGHPLRSRPARRASREAQQSETRANYRRPRGHPERSRPTGRARREADQPTPSTPNDGLPSQPERSRPSGRVGREAKQPVSRTPEVTSAAAAETQREPEPVPSTSTGVTSVVAARHGTDSPPPSAEPPNKPKWRRKPRGRRGRRFVEATPTAPVEEQSGAGGGPDERTSSKRARLDDTRSPRGEAKRPKTDTRQRQTVSYADASQSHLRVAVITVPPRDLSQEQADQLRETINDSILQAVLFPPSPSAQAPSFRGRPFLMDGVLAMWCEDENALAWLERETSRMTSPIPGTTLAVIRQSELKKRLKAGLLIHTRITDSKTLHKVLCAQNPWYKVDSWQCYDMSVADQPGTVDSREKVVHLILGIPEDQRQAILDRDRRVAHMTGSGYIRFFTPEDGNTAEPNPTVVSETAATPGPSTSAPQPGPSRMGASSPLTCEEEEISDEDGVLRSPDASS